MILVTVGTHNQGFDRLIEPMDLLAAQLDEQVVMQVGSSSYQPEHAKSFKFTSSAEMARLTDQARMLVMHAAAGSIILALKLSKPLVLVPRLKRYGEVMDDHQQQLAAALEARGQAASVIEPSVEALRSAISRAEKQQTSILGAEQLISSLRQELTGIS